MDNQQSSPAELSPREKGFITSIMRKYPAGQSTDKQLVRSMVIFGLIITMGHVLEQVLPTRWLALAIILPLGLFMFSRYRKFSIFRSCVLSKVAARLSKYEDLTPPARPGGAPHPHAGRGKPTDATPSGKPHPA